MGVRKRNAREDQAEASRLMHQSHGADMGVPKDAGKAAHGIWRAVPDPNGNRAERRAAKRAQRR